MDSHFKVLLAEPFTISTDDGYLVELVLSHDDNMIVSVGIVLARRVGGSSRESSSVEEILVRGHAEGRSAGHFRFELLSREQ